MSLVSDLGTVVVVGAGVKGASHILSKGLKPKKMRKSFNYMQYNEAVKYGKRRGWVGDSLRHSEAARGIKTGKYRIYERGYSNHPSDWHKDFYNKRQAKTYLNKVQKKTRSGENKYGFKKVRNVMLVKA